MPQDPSFSVSKDDSMNPGDGAINLSFNEQTNDSVIFKGASTNSFKLGDLEWFDSLPVMSDNWWICNIKRYVYLHVGAMMLAKSGRSLLMILSSMKLGHVNWI